jgi:hypothetical protein
MKEQKDTRKAEYIITIIGVILSIMSVYLINQKLNNKNIYNKTSINITTNNKELANLVTTTSTSAVTSMVTLTTTTTVKNTTTAPSTTTTTTTKVTTTKPIIAIGSEVLFDGLTKSELVDRLNKNLYDTMANTGIYFANYLEKTGLDPYLAVAIINLETGCKWGCSSLVKNNYNIGGLRGSGAYLKFDSLEEGINGYLDILYNNYWSKGLTTPEAMNSKYAASTEWANKVNRYINEIKAS